MVKLVMAKLMFCTYVLQLNTIKFVYKLPNFLTMKDLVLFGIQGCGKGTQARRLCEEFGFALFEAGGELRKIVSSGSPLGETVKSYINNGKLVPHDIIMEVVQTAIAAHPPHKIIIFDGIPRDNAQQTDFDKIIEKEGREIQGIHILLEREVAFSRILGRAKKEGRADDADEAAINKRMDTFYEKTMPVIETYKTRGLMIEIDGSGTVDEVYKQMTGIIKKLKNS